MITIGIVIVAGIIGIVSIYFLGPDNQVEQIAEKIIKDETGQDIDLSPSKNQEQPKAS